MLVDSAAGFWVVPPNRALWLVAGVRHSVRMSGAVRMRTAYIDAQRLGDLPDGTCVLNASPLLRKLLVEAVRVPVDYAERGRDGTLMTLLIHELRRAATLPLHLPMPADARLKAICERWRRSRRTRRRRRPGQSGSGSRRRRSTRLFQKDTGMSFAQWREQARLLYALRRIAEGARVVDIAFDCGYASQSAFAAMFRRHFGVPPSGVPGRQRGRGSRCLTPAGALPRTGRAS